MADTNNLKQVIATSISSLVVETFGRAFLKISGTWGGATATMEFKDSAGVWTAIVASTFTADVEKECFFPENISTEVRITLSGTTGPTSLSIRLTGSNRSN